MPSLVGSEMCIRDRICAIMALKITKIVEMGHEHFLDLLC